MMAEIAYSLVRASPLFTHVFCIHYACVVLLASLFVLASLNLNLKFVGSGSTGRPGRASLDDHLSGL